ncbi:hypothetical protein AMS68_007021 [Peltaster fructicola]|uniref:Amidohydrolase-related domain-containing protein n=1 Tax=Peltaster fructicola TaxID=286661 RepID=A0A6H0Y3B4_9PEZI|nr:hypothetical protein AMS68_007021 [Peltaster fructicola]
MVVRYGTDGDSSVLPDVRFKILQGPVVHSKSLRALEVLPHAYLGVRSNGTIAFLRTFGTLEDAQTEPGFQDAEISGLQPGQFLFPGLIDTHLHAPQWPNLGLGMEGSLREWIENWTDPVEASYSDTDKAERVYQEVVKTTLLLGSTTVAYNSSMHAEATRILAELCVRAGQRAIVGKMCVTQGSTSGNWEDSVEASLRDSQASLNHMRQLDSAKRLLHPSVMPRGGPYCPPDLMEGLGRQSSDYLTHVQVHMCETASDIDRALELHGADCYSDVYKTHGLFHSKTIAAHCIHLQPRDLENLKHCRVGVAHNPNSNTCLRDGECKVRDLLDNGIKVGLGTDCSAGYSPSILDAMRSASNVSRHLAVKENDERYILSFSEIVYLATLGGAHVVDMAGSIGNFEVGKQFDALLIDTESVPSMDRTLWHSGRAGLDAMVKKWVFLGDDRSVRKVWVAGKLVAGHDKSKE